MRARSFLTLFLIGAIFLVALLSLFGSKGLMEVLALKGRSEAIEEEIGRLRRQNASLAERIKRIHEDPSYLEQLARQELGMIKEGELLFIFPQERR